MAAPSTTLPAALHPDHVDDAVRRLRDYFTPLAEGGRAEGGEWDTFDPSFTRRASAGLLTADDVLSLAYLGVPALPVATTHRLLVRDADRLSELLRAVGPDRDLVDVDPEGPAYEPVRRLHRALTDLPGVDDTAATTLLARKRPRLVPLVDALVRRRVVDGSAPIRDLHALLVADDRALHRHLVDLACRAGLPAAVSPLRVLDVLARLDDDAHRGAQRP